MPKRPGLTKEKLIDAAIDLINNEGVPKLTIATLSTRFKVKPPSLYNHIDSLESLKQAMALKGIVELSQVGQKAAMGRAGSDALKAVAIAYRNFAKNQPGLYELTLRSNEGQSPELIKAEKEALEVFSGVLRAYKLSEENTIHAMRCIRSSLHGFVALELQGGFGLPISIEESFSYNLSILDHGLLALQEKS